MTDQYKKPDYIFEISWEVCNMVGGIYTVLSTKARTLQKEYKDKLIFVGPDIWKGKESPYFTEIPSLLNEWKKQLQFPYEIKVRTGRWNIPGNPIVILVNFDALYAVKNEFYGKMWELYGVESLQAYGDYDEACAFSHTAALVLENYYRFIKGEKLNIVAHFDEWTTGMGLLYIKHQLPCIATLFTTHATSIGRSIAGNNKPLYDYMKGYHGDQMAQELNMVSKHSVEKHAAQQADCFTTVSDITARECTQLLERTPDVVTPNGFEEDFIPDKANYIIKREEARERLLKIAYSLAGYYISKDAFLIATSGRYEYKNKGIDLFIDAMHRLSVKDELRKEIIAFVMVPAWVKAPRTDVADRVNSPLQATTPLPDPVITHTLNNYNEDRIINQIHKLGMQNRIHDKVKIIFIPSYLTGSDGIANLLYYDLLIGLDATAFPSYYEPWGYTPLESIAFGIPTITTDLSGFGQWINSRNEHGLEKTGVEVLHRTDSNYDEVADNLAQTVTELSNKSVKEKEIINKAAAKVACEAQWKNFIQYYSQAYDTALKKAEERNNKRLRQQ